MNTLLLLLAVALTVLLFIGLRTMQQDHLFSIAHRAETGVWAMVAVYMASITLFHVPSDLMRGAEMNLETAMMFKLLLAGLMVCRLLAVAAFTLGNPPKVRIEINATDKKPTLVPDTQSPGVEVDSHGDGRVLL